MHPYFFCSAQLKVINKLDFLFRWIWQIGTVSKLKPVFNPNPTVYRNQTFSWNRAFRLNKTRFNNNIMTLFIASTPVTKIKTFRSKDCTVFWSHRWVQPMRNSEFVAFQGQSLSSLWGFTRTQPGAFINSAALSASLSENNASVSIPTNSPLHNHAARVMRTTINQPQASSDA